MASMRVDEVRSGARASVMTRPSPNRQSRSGYSWVPLPGMNGKMPVWPSRPPQPGISGQTDELGQGLVIGIAGIGP